MFCILPVALALFQDTIPLKPKEEFEITLDYQLKPRPTGDYNTVNLTQSQITPRSATSAVLPYLILNIKLLTVPDSKSRAGISNNLVPRPVYRKVNTNSGFVLDLGFTDDMIDRVTAHQYTITVVDANRTPVNCILISVEEDGTFRVNGEVRGKF